MKWPMLVFLIVPLMTSCATGPAAPATSSPAPSATSTSVPVPSPTRTPAPPTPTVAPPAMIAELYDGVKVAEALNFNSLMRWRIWTPASTRLADGALELNGARDWTGAITYSTRLHVGMGVSMEFQPVQGQEYELVIDTGTWDTDSFRSFGVYGTRAPRADLWQGKEALGWKTLRGNLDLKPGAWYGFSMAIAEGREFFAIVWDIESPGHQALYREKLSEKWEGKTWEFVVQTNTGTTVRLDNFALFSFDSIK